MKVAAKIVAGAINVASHIKRIPVNPGLPVLILVIIVSVAVLADVVAPYSPLEGNLPDKRLPPSFTEGGNPGHFLGTDLYGRDVLSRIIHGSRVSLSVAALAIGVSATIGTIVGLIAGWTGGKLDALLMRLVDVGLSIPLILIAIVLAVAFGPSYQNVIVVLGLLIWPRFARQIRGETLNIKQHDHVALARVGGCSATRIILKHIFPNVVPSLLVLCTLNIGYVILLEASLSFLGVGIPAPTPSLGGMVAEGRGVLASAWWISLFPGLAIVFPVLSLNFFGDWVRDALDPKLRQI